MIIERIESEHSLPLGLMEFFSQKPIERSCGIMNGGGRQQNRCVKLSVTTPQGQFSATDTIHYGFSINFRDCTTGKINFTLLRSQFDAAATSHFMYWVIPLTNFLSNFVMSHPSLNRHPLRIYSTPIVPDGLPEEDAFIAAHNANLKNRLITFEFMGQPGFIEALLLKRFINRANLAHTRSGTIFDEGDKKGLKKGDKKGDTPGSSL
jgi:hypothetical protein